MCLPTIVSHSQNDREGNFESTSCHRNAGKHGKDYEKPYYWDVDINLTLN